MMIDCDYIKTNIDELMGIFCELHPDLSRSSKSQHRKAMLADWTKMSYKPVVLLYVERQNVLCERRCRQEMSQERDDERDALERENIKIKRRIEYQTKTIQDLKRDIKRMEKKYSLFETAILQSVDDRTCRNINFNYDINFNHVGALGLKRLPWRDDHKQVCVDEATLDERKEDFQNDTNILLTILKNSLGYQTRTEIDDEFYEWTERHVDIGLDRSKELYDTRDQEPAKQTKKEEEVDIYSLTNR